MNAKQRWAQAYRFARNGELIAWYRLAHGAPIGTDLAAIRLRGTRDIFNDRRPGRILDMIPEEWDT